MTKLAELPSPTRQTVGGMPPRNADDADAADADTAMMTKAGWGGGGVGEALGGSLLTVYGPALGMPRPGGAGGGGGGGGGGMWVRSTPKPNHLHTGKVRTRPHGTRLVCRRIS